MDGVFGVGITEMVIIVLVLFVIGGPENAAKWARQAGQYVRQFRKMWEDFSKDIEKELGPEGKELMDVTRELGQGAADLRRTTSPRNLLAQSVRAVDAMARDDTPSVRRSAAASSSAPAASEAPAPSEPPAPTAEAPARYRAWQPPEDRS